MFSAGAADWSADLSAASAVAGPSNAAIGQLRRGSLRTRLLLLVIGSVVAALMLSAFSAHQYYASARAAAEGAMVDRAMTLALALDQEASGTVTLMKTIAALSPPDGGGIEPFDAGLAAVAAQRPDLAISATPGTGSRATVPDSPGAIATPQFTSPEIGRELDSPALSIVMQVLLGGRRPITLTVGMDRARLHRLLNRNPSPAAWISAIIDQSERVVVRSDREEAIVGMRAIQAVRDGLSERPAGFVRARNLAGVRATIAFARAPLTGFATIISAPEEEFVRPLRDEVFRMLGNAALVTLAAGGLALLLTRQISQSLSRVTDDLAGGVPPSAGFAEIVDLATALQAATKQRDETLGTISRQQAMLRHLLDALPVSILIFGDDLVAFFANKFARDEFGEVPFTTSADREAMYHPDDLPRLRELRRYWASGVAHAPVELRYSIRGVQRWHLFQGVVSGSLPDGSRWHAVVVLDVHDAHEARAALAQANADLESRVAARTHELAATASELVAELSRHEQMQAALMQSQKREALGRLTGGVAHDVNNVLAVIANSYTTIELASADPIILESVVMGRAAVDHAAHLVRRLTSFTRQHPLAAETVDPSEALAEATALCRDALGEAFPLTLDVAEGLPAVSMDRQMFQAALLNLVINAREAMPGGGAVTIIARGSGHDAADVARTPGAPGETGTRSVAISVIDQGCGMSEQQIARAPEPFFTTKGEHGGSGFGLAMVDGFVTQSGGRLSIRSAPGFGTTVTMFLPGIARERRGTSSAVRPPPIARQRRGDGRTILLVDDNAPLLRSTSLLLRSYGYVVLVAPDARAAMELAIAHPEIDLVMTDIVMPDESGTALADRLAALRAGLPIIFITGFTGDERATGGRMVLRKPVNIRDMLAAFDAVLSANPA